MTQFQYKGQVINVNAYGTFETKIGDAELNADSLAGLKEKIDREQKAKEQVDKTPDLKLQVVVAFSSVGYKRYVRVATVSGVNRRDGALRVKGEGIERDTSFDYILPYTGANQQLLEQWVALTNQRVQLEMEIRKVQLDKRPGYGQISFEKYPKYQQALAEEYQQKLSLSVPQPVQV